MEILPIKVLTDTDSPVFGSLNVYLGQLVRLGLPVAPGVCVTAPNVKLETVLKHYDFTKKEVFEQTLTIIKKEINKTPISEILLKELDSHKKFWVSSQEFNSCKNTWFYLLDLWLLQIKHRIWQDGFYNGITQELEPKLIIFTGSFEGFGTAFFDPLQDDIVINIKQGKVDPADQKKISDLVLQANKKLIIPHEYEWIIDRGVKLTKVMPYTPSLQQPSLPIVINSKTRSGEAKCTVKVFTDLSKGFSIETKSDGIFLSSDKIYNLEKPSDSFEELLLKLVELGVTFPHVPILVKLPDVKDGMGGLRGALRLLHQKSLFEPITDAIIFALHKKGFKNIDLVLPFVRSYSELLELKRELATKKLSRRHNLKYWLELAVPENIINLEDYLLAGIDGVVLNLDELLSHISGFDLTKEELGFYKKEITALLKFLDVPFRVLHKAKVPIIAYGNLALNHQVLEFIIEKGVYGIVVEKFESHSIKDLFHQMEKRVILKKTI